MENSQLKFCLLTQQYWKDFESLFGERGACGGCWCMWFRLKNSEFEKKKGKENKKAMRSIVNTGNVPGILAFDGDLPVGWCSVSPRQNFSRLSRSRVLAPLDDLPVWSVVCFFVLKKYRNKGITLALLKVAIDYVEEQGGKIIEGYPVEPQKDRIPDVFAYNGLASTFRKAGFVESERRSKTRPIMRYYI